MQVNRFYRNPILFIAFLLALWLWVLLNPAPNTYACTWTGPASFTVTERTNDAEYVFEGTVLKINHPYGGAPSERNSDELDAASNPDIGSYSAIVAVQQYLKGTGPEVVEIGDFGFGGSCRSSAFPGSHLIFFANGIPTEQLEANYMVPYSAVEEVTEVNIAEAIKASGQQPIEVNLSFKYDFAIFFYRFWLLFVCLTPLVLVSLTWFVWKKRKRQKSVILPRHYGSSR